MTDSPSPTRSDEGLSRELDRIVRRLQSMALDSLPVERVHTAAQRLEELTAVAQGRAGRPVPRLRPYATADQLAVLGVGVLEAAAELQAAGDPEAAARLAAAANAELVNLRHTL